MKPPKGIAIGETFQGTPVLQVNFWADDEKDNPQYLRKVCGGMPLREFRREFLRDDKVSEGEAVLAEYSDERHLAREKLLPVPGGIFLAGWDTGDTLNHAVIIGELVPPFYQLRVLWELYDFNISLATFAESVQDFLKKEVPNWAFIRHFGDPAIRTRAGIMGESAWLYLARNYSLHIETAGITNQWAVRHAIAASLLLDRIEDDAPRIVFSEENTPVLLSALRGGWRFETTGEETASLFARKYRRRPRKDRYSHIGDAFVYLCQAVYQVLHKERGLALPVQGEEVVTGWAQV